MPKLLTEEVSTGSEGQLSPPQAAAQQETTTEPKPRKRGRGSIADRISAYLEAADPSHRLSPERGGAGPLRSPSPSATGEDETTVAVDTAADQSDAVVDETAPEAWGLKPSEAESSPLETPVSSHARQNPWKPGHSDAAPSESSGSEAPDFLQDNDFQFAAVATDEIPTAGGPPAADATASPSPLTVLASDSAPPPAAPPPALPTVPAPLASSNPLGASPRDRSSTPPHPRPPSLPPYIPPLRTPPAPPPATSARRAASASTSVTSMSPRRTPRKRGGEEEAWMMVAALEERLLEKEDELAMAIYLANCSEVPISAAIANRLSAFVAEDVGGHGEAFQLWVQQAARDRLGQQSEAETLRATAATMEDRLRELEAVVVQQRIEREAEARECEAASAGLLRSVALLEKAVAQAAATAAALRAEGAGERERRRRVESEAALVAADAIEAGRMAEDVGRARAQLEALRARRKEEQDAMAEEGRRRARSERMRDSTAETAQEAAARLLEEQKVTEQLRKRVGEVSSRCEEAQLAQQDAEREVYALQRMNRRLEQGMEEQGAVVERLEEEAGAGRRKARELAEEHEEYKATLSRKMGNVQVQLEKLKKERSQMLAARPVLEAQVQRLESVVERLRGEHEKTLSEVAEEHQREINDLMAQQQAEVEQLQERLQDCLEENGALLRERAQLQAEALENLESAPALNPQQPQATPTTAPRGQTDAGAEGPDFGGHPKGNKPREMDPAIARMAMRLDMRFESVTDRLSFQRELEEDVAFAAGLEPGSVEVSALKAGSVLAYMRVDTHHDALGRTAAEVVADLKRQAQEEGSPLLSGQHSRHCVQVRLLDEDAAGMAADGDAEDTGELRAELAAALEDKSSLMRRVVELEDVVVAQQEREHAVGVHSASLSRNASPPPVPPRPGTKKSAPSQRSGHSPPTPREPSRRRNQLVGRAWLVGTGGGLPERELLMQVADLRAEAEGATRQAVELKDKNQTLSKEKSRLADKLRDSERSQTKLREQLDMQALGGAHTIGSGAGINGGRQESVSSPAPGGGAEVEKKLATTQKELRRVTKSVQEIMASKEKLAHDKGELAKLNEQLQGKVATMGKVSKDRDALQRRLEEAHGAAQSKDREVVGLEGKVGKLQSTLSSVQGELAHAEDALAVANATEKLLQQDLQSVQAHNSLLQQQMAGLQERWIAETDKKVEMELEGERLRAEVAAVVDGSKDLQTLVEVLEELMPEVQDAAQFVLRDRARLATSTQRISQVAQAKSGEISGKDEAIRALEEEVQREQEARSALQREVDGMRHDTSKAQQQESEMVEKERAWAQQQEELAAKVTEQAVSLDEERSQRRVLQEELHRAEEQMREAMQLAESEARERAGAEDELSGEKTRGQKLEEALEEETVAVGELRERIGSLGDRADGLSAILNRRRAWALNEMQRRWMGWAMGGLEAAVLRSRLERTEEEAGRLRQRADEEGESARRWRRMAEEVMEGTAADEAKETAWVRREEALLERVKEVEAGRLELEEVQREREAREAELAQAKQEEERGVERDRDRRERELRDDLQRERRSLGVAQSQIETLTTQLALLQQQEFKRQQTQLAAGAPSLPLLNITHVDRAASLPASAKPSDLEEEDGGKDQGDAVIARVQDKTGKRAGTEVPQEEDQLVHAVPDANSLDASDSAGGKPLPSVAESVGRGLGSWAAFGADDNEDEFERAPGGETDAGLASPVDDTTLHGHATTRPTPTAIPEPSQVRSVPLVLAATPHAEGSSAPRLDPSGMPKSASEVPAWGIRLLVVEGRNMPHAESGGGEQLLACAVSVLAKSQAPSPWPLPACRDADNGGEGILTSSTSRTKSGVWTGAGTVSWGDELMLTAQREASSDAALSGAPVTVILTLHSEAQQRQDGDGRGDFVGGVEPEIGRATIDVAAATEQCLDVWCTLVLSPASSDVGSPDKTVPGPAPPAPQVRLRIAYGPAASLPPMATLRAEATPSLAPSLRSVPLSTATPMTSSPPKLPAPKRVPSPGGDGEAAVTSPDPVPPRTPMTPGDASLSVDSSGITDSAHRAAALPSPRQVLAGTAATSSPAPLFSLFDDEPAAPHDTTVATTNENKKDEAGSTAGKQQGEPLPGAEPSSTQEDEVEKDPEEGDGGWVGFGGDDDGDDFLGAETAQDVPTLNVDWFREQPHGGAGAGDDAISPRTVDQIKSLNTPDDKRQSAQSAVREAGRPFGNPGEQPGGMHVGSFAASGPQHPPASVAQPTPVPSTTAISVPAPVLPPVSAPKPPAPIISFAVKESVAASPRAAVPPAPKKPVAWDDDPVDLPPPPPRSNSWLARNLGIGSAAEVVGPDEWLCRAWVLETDGLPDILQADLSLSLSVIVPDPSSLLLPFQSMQHAVGAGGADPCYAPPAALLPPQHSTAAAPMRSRMDWSVDVGFTEAWHLSPKGHDGDDVLSKRRLDGGPAVVLVTAHASEGGRVLAVGQAAVPVREGTRSEQWAVMTSVGGGQVLGATGEPAMLQVATWYGRGRDVGAGWRPGSHVVPGIGMANLLRAFREEDGAKSQAAGRSAVREQRRWERKAVKAALPEELSLPEGWRWQLSRSTGKVFFRHAASGESRWKPPKGAALLPGVDERVPRPSAPEQHSPHSPGRTLLTWSAKIALLRVKGLAGAGACSGRGGLRARVSLVSADSGLSERQHRALDHALHAGPEDAVGGLEVVAQWETEGGLEASGEWGQQAVLTEEQPDVKTVERSCLRGRRVAAQDRRALSGRPVLLLLTVEQAEHGSHPADRVGRAVMPMRAGPRSTQWVPLLGADGLPLCGKGGRPALVEVQAAYGRPHNQVWMHEDPPALATPWARGVNPASDAHGDGEGSKAGSGDSDGEEHGGEEAGSEIRKMREEEAAKEQAERDERIEKLQRKGFRGFTPTP